MLVSTVNQQALPLYHSALACREFSTALGSSENTTQRSEKKDWISLRQILFSTVIAFAGSATLVSLFPSQSYRSSGDQPPPRNSGGNQGGESATNASALYLADPRNDVEASLHDEQDKRGIVVDELDREAHAPNVPILHDRRRVYDISARAIKGGRITMEDEYFVADGGRFAAVFDGHGGGGVSQYLKRRLYQQLGESLKELHDEESITCPQHQANPSLACLASALRDAFNRIEEDVLQDDALHYQGSTAVAVFLHDNEAGYRTVMSANIGDSRAILSRAGQAIDLTTDHKPNEEREKARIMRMGETIEWDRFAKVHRVRNLSLSRAIGDRYAKPIVSGEVEIKHFPVLDDRDEFILLASDGLWDAMSSQDVVSFVHDRIENELRNNDVMDSQEKDRYKLVLRKNMAKSVAYEAFKRGSGDNICVVMVWLDDT
ncbi:hypothetical protein FisN_3Lh510 [Fistulifera solaris]|uniref:PPM-type phosphatase domain-containing protein n=1 Tax=Fistulifera solaris TaxID=1519565 RepID=A0A1Z5J8I9_FISSO|nr:hypothetical protein FisN_3Lh510 [Fistulifera solaris]|eukprot:GAX10307.1 hypothetical protein FisN_3Lh510 [Fistulifera solaris]